MLLLFRLFSCACFCSFDVHLYHILMSLSSGLLLSHLNKYSRFSCYSWAPLHLFILLFLRETASLFSYPWISSLIFIDGHCFSFPFFLDEALHKSICLIIFHHTFLLLFQTLYFLWFPPVFVWIFYLIFPLTSSLSLMIFLFFLLCQWFILLHSFTFLFSFSLVILFPLSSFLSNRFMWLFHRFLTAFSCCNFCFFTTA